MESWIRRALVAAQNRDEFGRWIQGKKAAAAVNMGVKKPAAAAKMGVKKPGTGKTAASSSTPKKGKAAALEKGKEKVKAVAMEKAEAAAMAKEKKVALKTAEKQGAEKAEEKKAHMSIWELHNAVATKQEKIKTLEKALAATMELEDDVVVWELEVKLAKEMGMKNKFHGALQKVVRKIRPRVSGWKQAFGGSPRPLLG